jgi:hypothetical protein
MPPSFFQPSFFILFRESTWGCNSADEQASLLSQPGIPKLRHTAKHKLKFKGKGHEVRWFYLSDIPKVWLV